MRHKIKPTGNNRVVSILADGTVTEFIVTGGTWTNKYCNRRVAFWASTHAVTQKVLNKWVAK